MSQEDDRQKRADLDLGLSSEGLRKTVDQMRQRGYGKLEMDKKDIDTATRLGQEFLFFVQDALHNIGVKYEDVKKPISFETDPAKKELGEILKEAWNKRAKAWGWVESPTNYQATMSTLLTYFEASPRPIKEKVVSLGSGPGLYEAFLMYIYPKLKMPSKLEMYCVDFSREMTAINRRIIKTYKGEGGRMIEGVKPLTGDMANLDFPDGFFDQVICNNSLQCAPDWRKAVSEMARVTNHDRAGLMYLIINRNPMRIIDEKSNKTLHTLGDISPTELMDTLEEHIIQIENTRQFITAKGLGQMGGHSDRMFIKARYRKEGEISSWRDAEIKGATHFFGTRED
jgi:ubiquinone/menaquinone biosynthesis C-methylase UbiE